MMPIADLPVWQFDQLKWAAGQSTVS